MAIKRSIHTGLDENTLRLTVNTDRHELTVNFTVNANCLEDDFDSRATSIDDHSSSSSGSSISPAQHDYKFQVPFNQLHRVIVRRSPTARYVELIISLPTSSVPRFFKKVDPKTTFEDRETYWTQNRAWLRRTTVCSDQFGKWLNKKPLGLNQPEPYVDIGAWTVYRLCVDHDVFISPQGVQLRQALEENGVTFDHNENLQVSINGRHDALTSSATLWKMLDGDHKVQLGHTSMLMDLENDIALTWPVRYQLEVCISKNILHPTNISQEFLSWLSRRGERKALKLLEHIADKNNRVYDPMTLASVHPPKTSSMQKIHSNHVLQRSVTIKPSSMEYMTPSVDETNRIIRLYSNHADRFLRVVFRDEKSEGKIFSSDDEINDALFNRVKRCLDHGIQIGDRHFVWLASGNSQFREHGAYFVNPIPGVLTAERIRKDMGNFETMHHIAKINARMGQCFSTTKEYDGIPQVEEIPDVMISNICFTDGVGKISPFLTQRINTQMKFAQDTSAFQFRLGGAKGVLALWPDVTHQKVQIRPSQKKFDKGRERLEIIRPAVSVRPELNRQLITNLVCLGVPAAVFLKKLEKMLSDMNEAMTDADKAKRELRKRVDVNGMTLTMRDMVKAGFMREEDPFVRSLLLLWRAWAHKKLKEKAGIQVDEGAFLMGVVDESRTLRGHFTSSARPHPSTRTVLHSLPEIFLQVSNQADRTVSRVIEGVCIVARNPSLHPGDIRVVKAVDVPHLHHLKNVVVFPQTGDVDIPSMCSGGDLDGDDFFISWDRELIPPSYQEWNLQPMQHASAAPGWVPQVTEEDIKKFFVVHMKLDSLGRIANAWLAQADQVEDGSKAEVCKRLASLHSTAVDFPKNGVPASGKEFRRLRPKRHPHFLEGNRPAHKIYQSSSVLGKLYDKVQRIEYKPIMHLPFDRRVLESYSSNAELDEQVMILKNEYDEALRRIMAQFEVETEAEIWTAFVIEHGKGLNEYELQSKIGNLVGEHKERFREVCIEKAGGRDSDKLYPFVAAMYRVTAQQVKAELRQLVDTFGYESEGIPNMQAHERPLMSFPWLFHHELGRIAKTRTALRPADATLTPHPARNLTDNSTSNADDLRDIQQSGGEGVFSDKDQQHLPVARFLGNPLPHSVAPVCPANQAKMNKSPFDDDGALLDDFATLDFTITSSADNSLAGTADKMTSSLADPVACKTTQSDPTVSGSTVLGVGDGFNPPPDDARLPLAPLQNVISPSSKTRLGDELESDVGAEVENEEEEIEDEPPQTAFTRLAKLMRE